MPVLGHNHWKQAILEISREGAKHVLSEVEGDAKTKLKLEIRNAKPIQMIKNKEHKSPNRRVLDFVNRIKFLGLFRISSFGFRIFDSELLGVLAQ